MLQKYTVVGGIRKFAYVATRRSKDNPAFFVEREDPSLKNQPLAVQQKQIIVTCNYEARRQGLYKLQLVREARAQCPNLVVVLGEDLTRFRDASKDNYDFLRSFVWSNRVERLGFDEVFMDVTDMIDYNIGLLNWNNLSSAFFCLDRKDPSIGFSYQADIHFGHAFPAVPSELTPSILGSVDCDALRLRLSLGSHLARYLRLQLEEHKGFTSTVGISNNKLLSKLVGNLNKPKGQTTLLPPADPIGQNIDHVQAFLDDFDIGKIPGIGFKIAQKIREYVLNRPAAFDAGLVYGGTKENVKVRDVRLSLAGVGLQSLEKILAGPGMPRDLASKVWGLINGFDETEIAFSREVPQQISIEDSYIKLDEMSQVTAELRLLSVSLIKRMRVDLTIQDEEEAPHVVYTKESSTTAGNTVRWIAFPKVLRLTTRPRPPLNPDGTRSRTFARISRSCALPSLVFDLRATVESLSERLVSETLLPLFSKLHPEKRGWNLSLVNLCVTKMVIAGSDRREGAGRDISKMFKRQDEVLKEWRVTDPDPDTNDDDGDMDLDLRNDDGMPDRVHGYGDTLAQNEDKARRLDAENLDRDISDDIDLSSNESTDLPMDRPIPAEKESEADDYDYDYDDDDDYLDADSDSKVGNYCRLCGTAVPAFAMTAHERFHDMTS